MISAKYQKLTEILGISRILLSEPLNKYSSFRMGGPADIFFRAQTTQDLITAITEARNLKLPVFVFGGGTNLLISDKGFQGLVIKNDAAGIKLLGIKGKKTGNTLNKENSVQTVYLEVESGCTINRLVRFTLDQGFAGLEYFLGQPGTVGGAMYINAHNMKKELFFGDKVYQAKILDKTGKVKKVAADYFHFGYDQSILQQTADIVISIVLELTRGEKSKLWHEADETLKYRQKTQPTGVFSSGCIFRNISKSDAIRLATPKYTTSCGYLVDSVGMKGINIGEASFSAHHANFIIHKGGASAADVLELIKLAKNKVKKKYNLDIHEEIVLVGEF